MKGVILAGGLGSRLRPLTSITNKHLLPVYNKPMVYYPIQMLVDAGIRDIMVVTGGNSAGDFLRLLGNGEEFGLSRINYAYQKGEGGIAEALGLARDFCDDEQMVVVLGDNILEKGIARGVEAFAKQERGARIFLKSVEHPWEYGIAEVDGNRIVRIIEKPKDPPSNLAVIGVYMYPPDVFRIVDSLEPSGAASSRSPTSTMPTLSGARWSTRQSRAGGWTPVRTTKPCSGPTSRLLGSKGSTSERLRRHPNLQDGAPAAARIYCGRRSTPVRDHGRARRAALLSEPASSAL